MTDCRFIQHALVLLLLITPASRNFLRADEATAEQLEFFESKVRPLLSEHCYECHSVKATRVEGSLLLDSRSGHLKGGDSGPSVTPGEPDSSLLVEAVRYESYEMPPKGKLPAEEIEILAKWVKMGAPWPDEAAPTADAPTQKFDLEARRDDFWLWQKIAPEAAPDIVNLKWPRNDIDQFILAQLENSGLTPASDADRSAVLRRVYFDLIGLPPSPQEVTDFLSDTSPDALEKVVDELLASAQYGERWARHWLDLVRYAESRGHEFDNDTPNAFQYRDYVIRAFNDDVPYDQFIREHIAGDLLTQPRLNPEKQFNESILGTGFWFLGEWVHSPVDIRKDESDRFDNMLDVMSKTFLGVTLACARCHDHKFDAISTADYYSMSGFLQSSDYRQVRFESMEKNREVARKLAVLDRKYQVQITELLHEHGLTLPTQTSYLQDDSIVVDFSNLPQKELLQDGFIFGNSPRKPGRAYPNESGSFTIVSSGAVASDPIWHGLESVTEGIVHNQSKLAKLPKSGRTLRSPTFELKQGSVHCLVEGTGHVVACVDSHRLVAGPLHGETIVPIKEGQRWTTLRLGRYVGHRLHLEFIPTKDKSLSVRMVTQGSDKAKLDELDRRLQENNKKYQEYAYQANKLLNDPYKVEEWTFADFESGTYEGWTVEGEAFGEKPQTLETIASYQGRINGKGKFFVNSHNIRPGGDVRKGDSLTGTLTSSEFEIDFDLIEFWIGGGNHRGKTCVNLLIDGEPVLSATGRANNQMHLQSWNVQSFAGKKARIQVVDDHQSGWGNIGLDHIVFKRRLAVEGADPTAASESTLAIQSALRKVLQNWKTDRSRLGKQIVRKSRTAMAMLDGTGEDDHVLIRGNSSKPGEQEPRHFLTAVAGNSPIRIPIGSGRLQLAEQINSAENPLTSRVIVNRIWHHLMGRGIVPTVDDFGFLGERPTHPALLDHLATKFRAEGQSIKSMIKYIVLSRTYQMSSRPNATSLAADPKNLMWHYCPPRRLQGEAIRDSLLKISGRLDPKLYGPPVPIHLTEFMDGRGRPRKSGPLDGMGRRSIYTSVRRNFLSPFMLTFDSPVPFSSMGRRNVSNVPAQALILLNDPLVSDLAKEWGKQAIERFPGEDKKSKMNRLGWMYQAGFSRIPSAGELLAGLEFVESQEKTTSTEDGWGALAHALVNTKEFIFLR